MDCLTERGFASCPGDLAVFTIPNSVYGCFWQLDLDAVFGGRRCEAGTEGVEAYQSFAQELVEFLQFAEPGFSSRLVVETIVSRPGSISTTLDTELQAPLGLHTLATQHVECWVPESAPAAIMNFGDHPRALVYLNLPIADLVPTSEQAGEKSVEEVAREFMRRHPAYPLTRLVLSPREGCFGPFNTVIHDGYTADMTAPDFAVTVSPAPVVG